MKTPLGIELQIGQKWQECDSRFTRIVEVEGWDTEKGKVQLKSGYRHTLANLSRFNGRHGGYKFIK